MNLEQRIQALEDFKRLVAQWSRDQNPATRAKINQELTWVRKEVEDAGCLALVSYAAPWAAGGQIYKNIDPITNIFNEHLPDLLPRAIDMIDRTIGVLRKGPPRSQTEAATARAKSDLRLGYAFIAMPIEPDCPQNIDVHDAIKEAARRCGVEARRVDEDQSNDRITDRILESIRTAEYVIVDLTNTKPNVFFEAGYAHGIGKTPIYVAREKTRLEFDLKDYPIIFFANMKQLKDRLEVRLRALQNKQKQR